MQIDLVSKKYGLSKDTLRYYERIGLIPKVPRTASGIRDYDQESLNWIEFIKCMRSAGLSIETLILYVSLFERGDETLEERKQLLMEQRDILNQRIAEYQATLQRLNYKISLYETGEMMGKHLLKQVNAHKKEASGCYETVKEEEK